jgi:hypothetical protein
MFETCLRNLDLRRNAAYIQAAIVKTARVTLPLAGVGVLAASALDQVANRISALRIAPPCLNSGMFMYGVVQSISIFTNENSSLSSKTLSTMKGLTFIGASFFASDGASWLASFGQTQNLGTMMGGLTASFGASTFFAARTLSTALKNFMNGVTVEVDALCIDTFKSFLIPYALGPLATSCLGSVAPLGMAVLSAAVCKKFLRERTVDVPNSNLLQNLRLISKIGVVISAVGAVIACASSYGIKESLASAFLLETFID